MPPHLQEIETVLDAYLGFDPRYTPLWVKAEYEKRLLEAVPWLIEQVRNSINNGGSHE